MEITEAGEERDAFENIAKIKVNGRNQITIKDIKTQSRLQQIFKWNKSETIFEFFSGESLFSWLVGHWPSWMLFLKYYKQSSKLFPDITTKIFDLMVLCFLLVFLGSRVFYQWNVEISWDTNIWCVPSKDHVYRMVIVEVKQYLTKPNHCIWPIRAHYTFVSTNDYICM